MKLFVYGTLKKDFSGHNFLAPYIKNGDMKPFGKFEIHGFKLYVGIAPFLVRSDNKEDIVVGELYEIYNNVVIEKLDVGESWCYNREIVKDDVYAYVAKKSKYLDEAVYAGSVYTKKMDNIIKN